MRRPIIIGLISSTASFAWMLQAAEPLPLPSAALARKQQFEKTLEDSAKPHIARYLADLQRMAEEATKAGNWTLTDAIKLEIAEIELGYGFLKSQRLLGEWKCDSGTGISGVISCDATGKFTGWGYTGRLSVQGTDILIRWSNGGVYYLNRHQVGDVRKGHEISKRGERYELILTRK